MDGGSFCSPKLPICKNRLLVEIFNWHFPVLVKSSCYFIFDKYLLSIYCFPGLPAGRALNEPSSLGSQQTLCEHRANCSTVNQPLPSRSSHGVWIILKWLGESVTPTNLHFSTAHKFENHTFGSVPFTS